MVACVWYNTVTSECQWIITLCMWCSADACGSQPLVLVLLSESECQLWPNITWLATSPAAVLRLWDYGQTFFLVINSYCRSRAYSAQRTWSLWKCGSAKLWPRLWKIVHEMRKCVELRCETFFRVAWKTPCEAEAVGVVRAPLSWSGWAVLSEAEWTGYCAVCRNSQTIRIGEPWA